MIELKSILLFPFVLMMFIGCDSSNPAEEKASTECKLVKSNPADTALYNVISTFKETFVYFDIFTLRLYGIRRPLSGDSQPVFKQDTIEFWHWPIHPSTMIMEDATIRIDSFTVDMNYFTNIEIHSGYNTVSLRDWSLLNHHSPLEKSDDLRYRVPNFNRDSLKHVHEISYQELLDESGHYKFDETNSWRDILSKEDSANYETCYSAAIAKIVFDISFYSHNKKYVRTLILNDYRYSFDYPKWEE